MIDYEILEKVEKNILGEKAQTLKTGFSDLDLILNGVEKFSLITVGARPSMGKTCFITTIMLNLLKQNKKCLYFSLEMSIEQLAKRLIGQIAEVDAHLLNNTNSIPDKVKFINKIQTAVEILSKYDLTIYDNIFSTENIRENIELNKPEFVFIDYLQIIDVPSKKARFEALEQVMKELKQIAKDNNCIIFITSQLSRALEYRFDKTPLLSDLKDSGAIEYISDIVMLIYRYDYYQSISDEDYLINKDKAKIIVAKNKYGNPCCIELLFRSSIMKFLEPVHNAK